MAMAVKNASMERAEHARQVAHAAIDGLSARVLPLIDRAARRTHAMVERTAIGASDAADALVRGHSNLDIVGRAALGRTRDRIREYPLLSLAAAAFAGAIVYSFWRSRRELE